MNKYFLALAILTILSSCADPAEWRVQPYLTQRDSAKHSNSIKKELDSLFSTRVTKTVINDSVRHQPLNMNYPCPCCSYKTFRHEPNGSYDICGVCYWEDDPSQLKNPDDESGANRVSLRQAQKNFLLFGACERDMVKWVRKPAPDEQRDEGWKPLQSA